MFSTILRFVFFSVCTGLIVLILHHLMFEYSSWQAVMVNIYVCVSV